jgi:hypothetical protein
MIVTGRMSWTENVAWIGAMRILYEISVAKLEEKRHVGDLGKDERLILK